MAMDGSIASNAEAIAGDASRIHLRRQADYNRPAIGDVSSPDRYGGLVSWNAHASLERQIVGTQRAIEASVGAN